MTHSGKVTEALQFKLLATIMLNSGGGTPHCYNLENIQYIYICTIYIHCIYVCILHVVVYSWWGTLHGAETLPSAHSFYPLIQVLLLFGLHFLFIINSCIGF